MRLPRDVSGRELARAAGVLRYQVTRQTGRPIRLTATRNGEHHITIPAHEALKVRGISPDCSTTDADKGSTTPLASTGQLIPNTV
jgi:hypothetical protein